MGPAHIHLWFALCTASITHLDGMSKNESDQRRRDDATNCLGKINAYWNHLIAVEGGMPYLIKVLPYSVLHVQTKRPFSKSHLILVIKLREGSTEAAIFDTAMWNSLIWASASEKIGQAPAGDLERRIQKHLNDLNGF